jgi:endonuclease/exonuclease/phosphatase family metal-dependent hydrolase
VQIRVLSWNIFHGRDAPPNPALFTRRSRLLGRTEFDDTYAQVNRDLFEEIAAVLSGGDWEIALLQECPPRWSERLARACRADYHRALTARNWLRPITGWLADVNPDLIGSWEGGSNTTLVRPRLGRIVERRELAVRRALPERRAMAFTRLDSGLCIANLHASAHRQVLAEVEVMAAAKRATEWAIRDAPLIFGGDFNLRPGRTRVFDQLSQRYGLSPPSEPEAIDHLLARGLEVLGARRWSSEHRELETTVTTKDGENQTRLVRLSDHAPIEAVLDLF